MNNQINKIITTVMLMWRDWTENLDDGRDEGSATETAIIVGVVAFAALGLTTIIVAAINRYSAKIP